MLRLLRFLFTGTWHAHVWEQASEHHVYDDEKPGDRPWAKLHVLRCKSCGEMKNFRVFS